MCSAPLDLFSILELGGQQPSNAMVAMNQLTAGGQYLATVNRNRRKKASGLPNPKRMFEEVSGWLVGFVRFLFNYSLLKIYFNLTCYPAVRVLAPLTVIEPQYFFELIETNK